ncbi:Transposase IS4 [Popillia japonica]|uniref:Transposase IS4 n=1 Tax=Popillia japonica TaxID=7064 RepID=A0AAW1LTL7_POPJA
MAGQQSDYHCDSCLYSQANTVVGNGSKRPRKETVRFRDKNFEEKLMQWYVESKDEVDDDEEIDDLDRDPDYVLSDEEQTTQERNVENDNGSMSSDSEDDLLSVQTTMEV